LISLGAPRGDGPDGSVTKPTERGASTGNGMSMADDNKFRSNRSNDPHRREPTWSSQSDPLAELARLIGQSDPFAELGRSSQRQDQQRAEHRTQAAPPAAARD